MKARWGWLITGVLASVNGSAVTAQDAPMPAVLPAELPQAPAAPVRAVSRNPIDAAAISAPATSPPTLAIMTPSDGSCPTNDCCVKPSKSFTPFMLGDFVGPIANQFSDLKIAEGESPQPVDRVFHKSNYYNNLNKSRWADPTQSIHNVDLFRNTIGFEKTFFDKSFSFGLRIPFNTISAEGKDVFLLPDPNTGRLIPVTGEPDFTTTLLGNVSGIAKLVLWENRETGNLLSTGATLSFPTASNKKINPGMSTIAYMQPFTGFILNSGDMFLQGFSSLTLPIASAQSIVAFNDVGVGYWMMRDGAGLIKGISPTVELHVATPLRQIDTSSTEFGAVDGLRVFDVFDVTLGATILLRNNATIGLGFCVPMTGPKPFDIEAISQFNYRF